MKNAQIITLSKNHQRDLINNYGLNSRIISWGINPKIFPKQQEKTIDILGVGSLVEIKNFSFFIQIIAKLNKKIKNLKVEIIGGGDLEVYLKNEYLYLNLKDVISFEGKLPRKDVLEKMAKAKILLHTSSFESFGLVFLEALQSNMKIVSFDVGFAEKSNNWFVCKTEDEMLKNLKEILANFQMNNSESIHAIENTVLNYLKIYNE